MGRTPKVSAHQLAEIRRRKADIDLPYATSSGGKMCRRKSKPWSRNSNHISSSTKDDMPFIPILGSFGCKQLITAVNAFHSET